ncbi:NAD-dependent deacylase [Geoglobus acetivorans]|uniref:NAD-dependent protein deacylase n=1 Tax=Geoglobus acetivorans TaxID=565033 RepID=A0A0A7GGT7_GEOAI|nr:NAD-dependent protein deacetylase of SIR2 family [Geoglobus acetivorans]
MHVENTVEGLLELIKSCNGELVALTGAGISADSGIPTFRGKDGLWNKYRPEELATPEAFRKDPVLVWKWYAWRMNLVFNAEPNDAHIALALLERKGLLKAIVTQNVDNLHERAGSRNVIHLHGRIDEVRCTGCGRVGRLEKAPETIPPLCGCGALMRPNVVWFGEPLPAEALNLAVELCSQNSVIVIGTSAVVYPAAQLPYYAKKAGKTVIEVNPEITPLSDLADLSIRQRAGDAFRQIRAILEAGDSP